MNELQQIHFSQFETAKLMINAMNWRFRVAVVEQLSKIGITDYKVELAEKEKLTDVFEHFVRIKDDIVRSHRWSQAYTILELQFDEHKKYFKRYIDFLKKNGLYEKNKVCLCRDGWYYYKDKNGWQTRFV